MNRLFVQPKFGRRVRNEDGSLFKPDGETVAVTPHVRRLIADGDLVDCGAVPPKETKTEPKPTRRRAAKKGTSK